jgi:transcription elongation GreA/GreB family factor
MQIPKRRAEEEARQKKVVDHHLTPAALERLKKELNDLEKRAIPEGAAELHRTAEMGDLSENAAYQHAKDTLRRLHNRVLSLRYRINNAVIIQHGTDSIGRVSIGTTVTIEINGKEKTFEIVGSSETRPEKGRISYLSPLGAALLGHIAGESVVVETPDRQVTYKIIAIN